MAWLATGLILWAYFSFGPGTHRIFNLPFAMVVWPWYLNVVTHSDSEPIPKLINYVPINLKPEIITDLRVVKPAPPELIRPKRPKSNAPTITIEGGQ